MTRHCTTARGLVLGTALAILAAICTTSCQRDEAFAPETAPRKGFAIGLQLPPPGSWDDQVKAALQDSLHVWLYQLGTDADARFTQRPHPDDPSQPPFARASGEGSEELVLEIDPVAVPTWWRIFVRQGQLLGQTTFALAPQDRERITNVVLGPEAPAEERLVVYPGIPVGPGSSPPEEGGALTAETTLLFPVAVENPSPLTALWMEFALELSDACSIYADPGSRIFEAGDSLAYEFTVASLPGHDGDCRTFGLRMMRTLPAADPVPAGSSVLFYIAAAGDTSATALCVSPHSVRFAVAAGVDTLDSGQVVSPAECEYPSCTGTILSPATGAVLCEGGETTLTWETSSCCPQTVRIVLLRDGVVCRQIAASTANDGEHVWTVAGCTGAAGAYRVALLDAEDRVIAASAGSFTIEQACQPRLTSPNGGEQYRAGESASITWQSAGCCGNFVSIELLRDDTPCLTIAESTANDGELLWTVAACASQYGAYRVRVTDLDSGASDDSDQSFTIGPACTLDVTYPNGGELLCTGAPEVLTWSDTGLCGSTVRLELLTAGQSCLTIATAATNNGSYAWTVEPCPTGAGAYRLRVSDPQSGAADTSDAAFTIAGGCALAVTQPSENVSVCEGDPVEIAWTSSSCCGPAVRLVLLRGGSLCQTIADSVANQGPYVWTAARCEGSNHQYRVQVIDLTTGDTAVSSGTLQIDTCELAVTSPAGGEVLCLGDSLDITWTASACCGSSVGIELLCDGLVCGTITESTTNDGSLTWTVAASTGAGVGYAVRVTDLASGESATSSPFAIAEACAITVTGPLVDDYVCESVPVNVTWTASECCGPWFRIELLLEGQVCATLAPQTDSTGVFPWIPQQCSRLTDGYTIRITDVASGVSAETPAAFSIHPPCTINVVAPSGQESLCQGQSYDIEWEASGCCAETVTLELLRNGQPCETIDVADNNGLYTWTVAACGTSTDAYAIRITDPTSGLTGESSSFSIHTCTITVTNPAGGNALCTGSETLITWTHSTCCGNAVAIELLRAGELCLTIAGSVANNGRYSWIAAQCGGETADYRVRVRDLSTGAAGQSAAAFTIAPSCLIGITAPSAGDELCPGDQVDITWVASSCCPDTFTIELLCAGQVCQLISDDATGGTVSWIVPSDLAGTAGLRVRVSANGGAAVEESGLFSILDECALNFTYPNGGEELCEEQQITITWNSSTCCGSSVEIVLLREGEVVAHPATVTVNDGSFPWTPQRYDGISVGYQLRIRDLTTGAVDYTDAMFRINPACELVLLNPSYGGSYVVGEQVPISWTHTFCCGGTVRIRLTRNGSPCLTIASSTPNDGSYTWPAAQCQYGMTEGYKVEVTDLTTGASAESELPFVILLP
jgi:hypothetical protein